MRTIGVASLAIFFVILSSALAEVPRYKLPVGRKITYATTTESKGTSVATGKTNIELTVVRENPDGSRRIVIKTISERDEDGKKTQKAELSYADVFPDGRSLTKTLIGMGAESAMYLPRLPKDEAEMKKSWSVSNEELQEEWTYTPKTGGDGEFVFVGVDNGMMNKIYASTEVDTFKLDLAKGILTSKKAESTQDYGFHNRRTSEMTLTSDEMLSVSDAADLAADYDMLFNTQQLYHDKMVTMPKDPEHLTAIAADAKAMLDKALAQAKSDPVKGALKKIADNHEEWIREAKEDDFKAVMNLPASDWSAKDIDGKPVKLSDFRGKIVVMDFWYRGCGWCMYAMPQVKKLHEDFKDKNVVFLGMNTDKKEEDARFVIDAMGLKYATIKAEGIPEKFGVRGFPTLVIVDQQVVVRDIHVGYTPTLHKDLTEKLNTLLAKPAASTAGK